MSYDRTKRNYGSNRNTGYRPNRFSNGERSNGSFNRSRPSRFNRNRGRGGYSRNNATKIDPQRYIASPKPIVKYESEMNFSEFDLHEKLMRNITQKGYEKPTQIQEKTIPIIMQGKNILGISATGSGKTAAFLIPIINKILSNQSNEKLLIIAPTRELAMQIQKEGIDLVRGTNIQIVRVIGGENIQNQIRFMRKNPQIVIGTPGRLKDLYERRVIRLESFNNLVLDEVDRMLDMGFVDEIKFLTGKMAQKKQTLFFSATVNTQIEKVIVSIENNYESIRLQENTSSENVHQDIVKVSSYTEKIDKLHQILLTEEVEKTLIFIETKREVDKVARELVNRGHKVDGIHGNKSQSQRKRIIESYRSNRVTILLATNVVARGLDVPDITHVINFDEPQTYDEYIHRIGRTGRNGKSGKALTFVK